VTLERLVALIERCFAVILEVSKERREINDLSNLQAIFVTLATLVKVA
jgi:hypothetical protein